MSSKKILAIGAHPDDESLWCGGWLAEHPGTHVACCSVDTRKPYRTGYFYDACAVLGASPYVIAGQFSTTWIDVEPIMRFALDYDVIITHNAKGEYGHPSHIMLHEALTRLPRTVYTFNYGIEDGTPLPEDVWSKKLEAIRCYQNPQILENQSRNFDLSRESLVRSSCF